ncbi:hypothetical protein TIFTF001_015335 [Ficus carica]|uniref:inorganic diphosphatase n=1 Tax=Ficus carica TaxID=3494 RepID=A0AA88A5G8_FICCA|nr:hypothetical protein TIFTF001_015335 [Ficus carica]
MAMADGLGVRVSLQCCSSERVGRRSPSAAAAAATTATTGTSLAMEKTWDGKGNMRLGFVFSSFESDSIFLEASPWVSNEFVLFRNPIEGEKDDKIIGVCSNDPEFPHFSSISELPPHHLQEIRQYFEDNILP